MTMRNRRKKALLIGGGIAGPVVAMALERAGVDAAIFEARPEGAEGLGAFLTLAVNGLVSLRSLGVDLASLGGFETPRITLALGSGRLLAEVPRGPTFDGVCTRTVRRADLHRALEVEAQRRGIRLERGKKLVAVERAGSSAGSGVVARFADGTAEEGDFLIGADGVHSRVRSSIDPDAPRPAYVGLLNTGGFARGIGVLGEVGTMQMFFGKRCFFAYVPHPNGEVWWFANPGRAHEPTRDELRAIGDDAWRERLARMFDDDATPAAAIVRATEHELPCWATYDLAKVPTWHRDRMLIIGDAAHAASPSSGQGASMAIEDGVALGLALRDERSIEDAFARYEALRRARVERVVAVGRRNGDGKTPGPLGRIVRDLVLRFVFARMMKSGENPMSWLYDEMVEWPREGAGTGVAGTEVETTRAA